MKVKEENPSLTLRQVPEMDEDHRRIPSLTLRQVAGMNEGYGSKPAAGYRGAGLLKEKAAL